MKKRRIEVALLAALAMLALGDMPSLPDTAGVSAAMISVGDFAPQRVEGVADLGLIAVKLLVTWLG